MWVTECGIVPPRNGNHRKYTIVRFTTRGKTLADISSQMLTVLALSRSILLTSNEARKIVFLFFFVFFFFASSSIWSARVHIRVFLYLSTIVLDIDVQSFNVQTDNNRTYEGLLSCHGLR